MGLDDERSMLLSFKNMLCNYINVKLFLPPSLSQKKEDAHHSEAYLWVGPEEGFGKVDMNRRKLTPHQFER